MPVGQKDITLIIRARDQASGIIRQVGASVKMLDEGARGAATAQMQSGAQLMLLGGAITAVGAVGIAVAKGWTDAAIEYNRQTALTRTQVDDVGVSMEELGRIGLDVAKKIPAPLEEMQTALFDIFSSMDVSVADSQILLEGFAKAAVAGQVDIQTAGRASISLMNAYGLGVEDLDRVMDVQFQLVRKGVGTYDEFASSIGRAIPSARRSGQSIETLAGSLAFLTRNGLSAQQASTSAARAFDNLAKPSVIKNLDKLGVSVVDGQGNFRQMADVVSDLGKRLDGLTDVEKAKALDEIFKGGGNNIQARRFWDLAIRNYDELQQRVDEMVNSKGALEAAYQTMFETPAMQSQLFHNQLQALRIELGQALLPIFNELLAIGRQVVQWFNDLDPSTKAFIAQVVVIGSVIAVAIGAFIMLVGALEALGGAIGFITGIGAIGFGPLLLLLGAVAAAAYLVYDNWETIKRWWGELWPEIQRIAEGVWNWIRDTWGTLWPEAKRIAGEVWGWIETKWGEIWPEVKRVASETWDWIQDRWSVLWPEVKRIASETWQWMQRTWDTTVSAIKTAAAWFWETFGPSIISVLDEIKEHWRGLVQILLIVTNPIIAVYEAFKNWDKIKPIVDKVWSYIYGFWTEVKTVAMWFSDTFGPGFVKVWNSIRDNVRPVIESLISIFTVFGIIVAGIVMIVVTVFNTVFLPVLQNIADRWSTIWTGMQNMFIGVWTIITSLISGFLNIISGWLQIFADIVTLDWEELWNDVKELAKDYWDAISGVIIGVATFIWGMLQIIWSIIFGILETIWNTIKGTAERIWNEITGDIIYAVATVWNWIVTAWNIIDGILTGIWNGISSTATRIWNEIKDAIMDPINTLTGLLATAWTTIQTAAELAWGEIKGAASRIWAEIKDTVMDPLNRLEAAISLVWGGIKTTAETVWDEIRDAVSGPINAIKGFIQGLIDKIQGIIDRVASAKAALASLNPFASGGASGNYTGGGATYAPNPVPPGGAIGKYIDTKQLMWVGEHGNEVLLPMNDMRRATNLMKTAAARNPQFADLMSPTVVPVASGNSVVIQPGAVQVHISGVSDDMAAMVQATIDNSFKELQRSVRNSVKGPYS